MKRLLLTLFLAPSLLLAQSLALDVFDGDDFAQVDVTLGANSLLGFGADGQPARITAGTGITISGNVITSSGGGGGSSTLAGLTDVTLTSPANNQLLRYHSGSSKWVNWTPDFLVSSDLSGYLTSATAATTYVSLSGSYVNPTWINSLAFTKLSGLPTTLAGYGISDAITAATASSLYAPIDSPSFTGNLSVAGGSVTALNFNPSHEAFHFIHPSSAGEVTSKLIVDETNGTERDAVTWILRHNVGGTIAYLSDLTSLNASNLTSGTVADARLSGNVTLLGSSIALGSEVSGILPIANGGTGQSTTSAARLAILPSITGNAGKYLRVNGAATDYELATISGGGDAVTTSSLDQFSDVTQAAGKTLAISDSTVLNGGTHSGTNTGDQTSVTGNAGTATVLQTPRSINGVAFDGSTDITVTAAAGTLSGSTLASGVTTSSLTGLGIVATGTWQATPIADAYIASSSTWNAKESPLTFSTGLTRSTNTVTVNTTQNITTLSNLTGNGFVKTSGGTGALSIDTSTYLTTTGNGSGLTGLTQSQVSGLTTTDRAQFANTRITSSTLTYAATTNLDCDGDGFQTLSLTGNVTFTTSNRASGRSKTIRIVADGSSRNLTFPAGWTFVGAAAPSSIAASKTAILTVTFFGTADSDAIAAYAVQP